MPSVFVDPFFRLSEPAQEVEIRDFEKEFGSFIKRSMIQHPFHLWSKKVLMPYLLSLLPKNWKPKDLEEWFDVDKGTVSKWLKDVHLPKEEVIHHWIHRFDAAYPADRSGIYTAHAAIRALNRIRFERETTDLQDERRVLGKYQTEFDLENTAILFALISPPLFNSWKSIVLRFNDDMHRAIDASEVSRFLADSIDVAVDLFGRKKPMPYFEATVIRIAAVDLSNPNEARQYLDQLIRLWEPVQKDAYCLMQCIEDELLPKR